MHWNSLSDFLAMGGYGLYVWGSFLMTFGVLGWELLLLSQRRKRSIEEVRNWRLLQGESNGVGNDTSS